LVTTVVAGTTVLDTAGDESVAVKLKSDPACTPVPDNATDCGLAGALSVIVRAAVCVPVTAGVNVTVIVQIAPGATIDPQLLVCAKLPVVVMLAIDSGKSPAFFSEIFFDPAVPVDCAPNERLAGESTIAADDVPVPDKLTVCGLPVALSATDSVPVIAPEAGGSKTTLIVQLFVPDPGSPRVEQLFDCVNPFDALTDVTVRAAVPVLVSVTVCGLLGVPTGWLENVTEDVLKLAIAVTPLPASWSVCGLPAALSVTVSVPVRAPDAVGVKVTEMVHVPPAGKLFAVVVHVSVSLKSPVAAIELIASVEVPRFVTVTVWGELVFPCRVLWKLTAAGVNPAAAPAVEEIFVTNAARTGSCWLFL
jgi:hypothetical protein